MYQQSPRDPYFTNLERYENLLQVLLDLGAFESIHLLEVLTHIFDTIGINILVTS